MIGLLAVINTKAENKNTLKISFKTFFIGFPEKVR